jgi:hypothetical protein
MGLPMKPIEKCQFCGVRDWEQFQVGRVYLWRCANCGVHPGREVNRWTCAMWLIYLGYGVPIVLGLGLFLYVVISCNN